ncbi:hypothetical protein D3C81_1082730 [compost metagenome]
MIVVPTARRIAGSVVEQQVVQQHIVPTETAAVMVDDGGATRAAGTGSPLGALSILLQRKWDVPVHILVEVLFHFFRRPGDQLRFIRRRTVPRGRCSGTRNQESVSQQRDAKRRRQDADGLAFRSKKLRCERFFHRGCLFRSNRIRSCYFVFFCQDRFPPYEKNLLFMHDWNEQQLQLALVDVESAFHGFKLPVADDQVVHMLQRGHHIRAPNALFQFPQLAIRQLFVQLDAQAVVQCISPFPCTH